MPENQNNQEQKMKALELVKGQIEKQYGKGSLMKLGAHGGIAIQSIPSGSLLLDEALGIGGYPKGRVIEIYGPESSGKTTLSLHAIAECQKAGGIAAFIDAEHALDPIYAKALGVDVDNLWIAQPDTGEQALEITEHLCRSGAVDLIVVDSVAALTPQAEIDGTMGDTHVGLQARLMSQALRKLTSILSKADCALIFINQLRMKIGVMFGNPETTTGGVALKFYSSLRLDVRKIETMGMTRTSATNTNAEEPRGNRIRVRVVKNKVAPPFRKVELELIFGQGISHYADIFESALNHGLIDKAGSWFTLYDQRYQGRENVIKFLESQPEIVEKIEKQIRQQVFSPDKTAEDLKKTKEAKEPKSESK